MAMVEKIVSGGQSGVDRAALDVALSLAIPCGGWCPKGRKAEDGLIDPRYPLMETPSEDYAQRTEWNVRDSDGTLILSDGGLTGGTAQTVDAARRLGKPQLMLELSAQPPPLVVQAWTNANRVRVLNIAGPRESKRPGIYARAAAFLKAVFSAAALNDTTPHAT